MDFEPTDRQRNALLLTAGLIIGISGTFAALEVDTNRDEISRDVVTVLEDSTGQDVELVNFEEENGLYRADMKDSSNQLVTYYVTKDGEKLSQNMVDLDEVRKATEARKEFSSCLEDRNVTMYGNASQQATQLQIQALGGAQTVSTVFEDVNNRQVLQEAVSRGINRVPAFYTGGETLQGVNQVGQIEKFTGCSYGIE